MFEFHWSWEDFLFGFKQCIHHKFFSIHIGFMTFAFCWAIEEDISDWFGFDEDDE